MPSYTRECIECGKVDTLKKKPRSEHCKKCSTKLCGERLRDDSKLMCACGNSKSYSGNTCKKCAMDKLGKAKRIGTHEVHRRANIKGLEILSIFEHTEQKADFRCLSCDYTFNVHIGNVINKTKGCPKCTKLKGENHPNWDSTISDKDRVYKRGYKFIVWSKAIKDVANYKCDICNDGGYLESHHLESYAVKKELRYDLDNGVCLCRECHYNFHQDYGYKNSTKEQYLNFKGLQNG